MKNTMHLLGMLFLAQSMLCLPLDSPSTETPTTTLAPESNSSTTTSAPINSTATDHPADADKHPANCTHMNPAVFNAPVSLTIDLVELIPTDSAEPHPIETREAGKGTDDLIASLSSSIQAKLSGAAATKPAVVPAPAPADISKTAPAPAPIAPADISKTAAATPVAPADSSAAPAPIAPADSSAAPAPIAPADSSAAPAPIAPADPKIASDNKTAEIPAAPASLNKTEEIPTTPALANKTEETPKLVTRAAEEESKTETLVGKIKQWVEDKLSLTKPAEAAAPAANTSTSDPVPSPAPDAGNKTVEAPKNDTKVTRDAEKSAMNPPLVLDAAAKLNETAGNSTDAKPIPSSISKVTTEAEKSVVTSNSTESVAEPSAPAAPAAAAPSQTEKIIGKVLEGALVEKKKAHISKRSYGSSAGSAPSDVPAPAAPATKYSYAVRHAPAPAAPSPAAPSDSSSAAPATRSDSGYSAPAPATRSDSGYSAPAPAARSDSGYLAPAKSARYESGYAAPAPAPTTSAPDSAPTTSAPTPAPTTSAPDSAPTTAAPASISSSNSGYAAPARYRRGTTESLASESAIPKENLGKTKDLPTVLSAPSKVVSTGV